MVLKTSDREFQEILSVVAEHPAGVGIAALADALALRLGHPLIRRTLQRRLDRLIGEKKIAGVGNSVARLYVLGTGLVAPLPTWDLVVAEPRPAWGVPAPTPAPTPVPLAGSYVPVSNEGALIREQVSRALMHRRPVGYRREFLESYEPGVSWYLPKSIRVQLHEIGRTSAGERPAGTYARDVLTRLLVDLSWASSRLEGNTYSRLDTQNLIEFGQAAQGKDAQETQMILNHKAAIEMLVEDVDEVGFDVFTFQNLHAVLSQNLMRDDAASGRLRHKVVEISGTVFYPLALPALIEDCFRLLLAKAAAINEPFEQAFFLMVHLPYLQPFEDVNKRVSRLGANIPLIRHNLCPLSFLDVPERAYVDGTLGVYELNQVELLRDVFVWAYERSCQRYLAITNHMADPDPLRMQYRDALIKAVQTIVRGGLAATAPVVAQVSNPLVAQKDREAFERLLTDSIANLHEGSVARYRLKRSEFLAWQGAMRG